MNYNIIKEELKKYPEIKVMNYLAYIKHIQTAKKSDTNKLLYWWAPDLTESQCIEFFKKIADEKLYIDGDMVSLQYRGKVIIELSYHAYKNVVLMKYPETKLDIQLVKEGDEFNFEKKNGKVLYTHKIKNAFDNAKTRGAYCIIKNKVGEFIEVMSFQDLEQIRKLAKTKFIWDAWTEEMYLKTILRRACKRHFKNIVVNIDKIDNENFDLEKEDKKECDATLNIFKKWLDDKKITEEVQESLIAKFTDLDMEGRRGFCQEILNALKDNRIEDLL